MGMQQNMIELIEQQKVSFGPQRGIPRRIMNSRKTEKRKINSSPEKVHRQCITAFYYQVKNIQKQQTSAGSQSKSGFHHPSTQALHLKRQPLVPHPRQPLVPPLAAEQPHRLVRRRSRAWHQARSRLSCTNQRCQHDVWIWSMDPDKILTVTPPIIPQCHFLRSYGCKHRNSIVGPSQRHVNDFNNQNRR